MKDEELEKTKPIEVLSELSRSTKYEDAVKETREEKYQDNVEDVEKSEASEAAEEALAEKNIMEAEALLKEEEEREEVNTVTPELVVKGEKESPFKKLKEKWNKMPKNKKVLLIVILILILILIGVLVAFLVLKKDKVVEKPDDKPTATEIEEAPVITDNYYYREGKLYFTDENEEVLGNYECENKDSNLCYVAFNNDRDSFDVPILQDESGKEKTTRLQIYEERYVFIRDNKDENDETVKLFSMTDNKLVGTYLTVKAYSDNYVIVEDTNKNYGLIKISDGVNEIIKPQYSYLGMVNGSTNLIAKNKKGYVVIDSNNKVLSSPIPANAVVKSYNESMIVATINNEYNVYDYKANLVAGGATYASLAGNYVALVDSEKNLTIRGVDKVKYNEGDIKLEYNNYVKTYIYDSEGNIKKVKRSYELNVKDESIEVAIYDKDGEVTYENVEYVYGLANKKYKHVNYFNGKLYFYKDAEKEELIGSYTCSNKNYIEKDSDNYTSCFPAKDTIYEDNDMMAERDVNRKSMSPLINNTYVFISDGTNNVKLYDLLQSKSLGTYSSINTYSYANDYTFYSYEGEMEVVGLNKKGKYGVLAFDKNGVTAKYTFDYSAIEKLDKYYSISEDGTKYKLKYEDNRESVEFPGKIMEYQGDLKYFSVYSGKKYSVYNNDGSQNITDKFAFVDLYTSFFAAVDDNKMIYIYDYSGNKISEEGVKVTDYPYSKVDNKAFKVAKDGNKYIISVYNGSTYDDHEIVPGSTSKPDDDKDKDKDKDKEETPTQTE